MRVNSGGCRDSDRGIAAAALIVFIGLFLLLTVVAGGLYLVTSGGADSGDPTKLELSASRCDVVTQNDTTGVGSVTFSLTYRGTGTLDLSEGTLRYSDGDTTHEFEIAANGSTDTLRVLNDSGVYDPLVGSDESHSITVPLASVRGEPLPSATRGRVEVIVDSVSTGGTSFRTPGAIGHESAYVDC